MQWDGTSWVSTLMTGANKYYYEPYIPTGVANIHNNRAQLQLYPVPATNTLYLQLTEEKRQIYTVNITDMQGRRVLQQSYLGNTTQHFDISKLSAGMYNITLLSNKGQMQHSKFTVVR